MKDHASPNLALSAPTVWRSIAASALIASGLFALVAADGGGAAPEATARVLEQAAGMARNLDALPWRVPWCEVNSLPASCSTVPYDAPRLVSVPSLDGGALRGALRADAPGVVRYQNVQYQHVLADRAAGLASQYDLDLFLRVSNEDYQAVELGFQVWLARGQHADMAVQFRPSGEVYFWSGRQGSWLPLTTARLAPNAWHRVGLSGRLVGDRQQYTALRINDRVIPMTRSFRLMAEGGANEAAVFVQLDGRGLPYEVFLDGVQLSWR